MIILMSILIDNIISTETPYSPLNVDFSCNCSISLKANMRLPTKLSIQIWAKSGSSKFGSKKMLAQVSPSLYIGYPGHHLQTYEFSEDPQTFKGGKDDQEHRFAVGTIDIQAYVEPNEGKLLTYPNVDAKI